MTTSKSSPRDDGASCPKCGYRWLPRVAEPKRCARCGKWLLEKPDVLASRDTFLKNIQDAVATMRDARSAKARAAWEKKRKN